MILSLILMSLWAVIWLLYLNQLPSYRRQNPCHLPPAGTLQKYLRLLLPVCGLTMAYLLNGLDGLFLWAFTAPLTGFLLAMLLSYLQPPSPPGRTELAKRPKSPQIPAMHIRLSSLLTSAFIVSAAFLGLSPAARADRPWQDAHTQAQITAEHELSQPLAASLSSLPDGSPFALSVTGKVYRLDPVDGHLTILMDELPPITALTATAQGLWAVTQAPQPALLNIAPDTGVILNHIGFGSTLAVGSHISALQVTDNNAFLVDDGVPAFVVIDLQSGHAERLLEGAPSLSSHAPLMRHGQPVTTAQGQSRTGGNVHFLLLDRNKNWLFYQTPTGPLYRIGTTILTDSSLGPAERIEAMTNWRRTPSLGGMTINRDDTIYMVDIDHGDLLAFGADRLPWRLLHDDRLYDAQAISLLKGRTGEQGQLAILTNPAASAGGTNPASTPNPQHLLEITLP